MTVFGKKKLETELKHLISVERPAVISAIEEARSHGDLSENADYDAARERQGFIEGRISELQDKLARAEVIDPTAIKADTVAFGATVTLEDVDTEELRKYQIVGVDEADVKENKIGITSPLARSLIGKRKGDEAVVRAPKGDIAYSIIEIQYR